MPFPLYKPHICYVVGKAFAILLELASHQRMGLLQGPTRLSGHTSIKWWARLFGL
jgi:hypothetical protein